MKRHIIYIIGSGRSGTTLLDIILGANEDIFSGGELTRYALRQGVPTGFPQNSERTKFWREFTEQFKQRYDLLKAEDLIHEFEYYNISSVKQILGFSNRKRYGAYQQFIHDFFLELFDKIEENVVVDSSKYPNRALHLSDSLRDFKISYLYIKRDPVGVVKSFAKTDVYIPPKNWLKANLYYFLSNLICMWTVGRLRRKHKVLEVKYEDLVSHPVEELQKMAIAFDLDLSTAMKKIESDDDLRVGNLFEGNSLRIKEKIRLNRGVPEHPVTIKNILTRIFNLPIYN